MDSASLGPYEPDFFEGFHGQDLEISVDIRNLLEQATFGFQPAYLALAPRVMVLGLNMQRIFRRVPLWYPHFVAVSRPVETAQVGQETGNQPFYGQGTSGFFTGSQCVAMVHVAG